MIDVNKITSTLAKLPDQQLQQYAQMHKNDPYTMALAMAESNRRKEMRAAGQGAQGMQEQPKVVDQMVAEMAPQQMPEDQGIGQLPAGDMNFAGGGIIAFADGGDVERYQSGGNIFAQMDQQKAAQLAQLNSQLATIEPQLRAAAASGDQQAIQTYAQQAQAIRGQINAVREAAGNRIGLIESTSAPPAAPPARVAPAAPTGQFNRMAGAEQFGLPAAATAKSGAMPEPGYTRPGMLYDPRLNTPPTQPVVAAPAAPTADPTRRVGPPAAPLAAPSAATPAQAGLGDLAAMRQDILNKQTYTDPAEAGLGELERRELVAAKESKAALDRDQAKFSEAFKGREKRLTDRELDIGKQKDVNKGLAFLNAGLAIMSTPGGLATAIGKGAQVGTAQFAAGLDKIRSAQERLDEARDRMEELRLNRDEMSAREIRATEAAIRDVGVNAQKRVIDGIRAAANVNETRASDIYRAAVQVGVTGMEIQGRKDAAQVAAGPGYERNKMLRDAQGNESNVRAEYGKLQARVMDTLSKDANYQMANPTMQSVMYTNALRQAVSTNPFLASYASGIGFSSAPTGKVYDLTED